MFNTILFDFNGVILDDEQVHFELFKKVLLDEEIILTDKDYWSIYLGFDDKGLFDAIFKNNKKNLTPKKLKDLIAKKASLYLSSLSGHVKFFPGVLTFIKEVSEKYNLAVVSGALRAEIEAALDLGGVRKHFPLIVSAEDTKHGKPDPEGYLLALAKIKKNHPEVRNDTCLVIEDSLAGIESAHRAQMKCVALPHSYAQDVLKKEADWVVERFDKIKNTCL